VTEHPPAALDHSPDRRRDSRLPVSEPYGIPFPIGTFGLIMARYFHELGTTAGRFAEIEVAARRWAQLNSKAWPKDPLMIGTRPIPLLRRP